MATCPLGFWPRRPALLWRDADALAITGPVGHAWYGGLDRLVTRIARPGTPRFIITKVAADEGLFGPLHVLGFFAFMTKAEGGSWQARPPFYSHPRPRPAH